MRDGIGSCREWEKELIRSSKGNKNKSSGIEWRAKGDSAMSVIVTRGERPLEGSLRAQGSKNAVLPILAASILAGCETELTNVPELSDVSATSNILEAMGCKTERDGDVFRIDSRSMDTPEISSDLMRKMRSSVIFLGALLARSGEAKMSIPGGCELGPRPIDLHLMALRALGAEIIEYGGDIIARCTKLRGAVINLPLPSVGATENAMLAACGAEGRTVIHNAAREPEIVDLQRFLRTLGAEVSGAGTYTVTVEGFLPKPRVGHRIIPDRIVSATMLSATAACGGDLELMGADTSDMECILGTFSRMGCTILSTPQSIRIKSDAMLSAPAPIFTAPYPGFPTDAQPVTLAACLKARGNTVFVERMFTGRYRYLEALKSMGADIYTEGGVAVIRGVNRLRGAEVESTDLRGAAALVIAGLSAAGETRIKDTGHLVRGYERLDENLRGLGADIYIENDS